MASPSLPGVFALCWCHSMRRLIGAKTEHLGALVKRCPPIGARHRSGSGNAITEHWHGRFAQAPWTNSAFNADATMGHRFAILMAHGGALRASRFGAGLLGR